MPQLDNPRQERFAIYIAKGHSQSEAYRKAGYKTVGRDACAKNAARLMKSDEVAVRVAELKHRLAEAQGIDADLLLIELEEARTIAMQQKHPAPAVGAITAKAKLLGLIVDRAEIETTARRPMREPTDVKRMSLEEWQKKFAPKGLQKPEAANDAEEEAG